MFGCKAKIGPVLSSLIEDDERNGDKKTQKKVITFLKYIISPSTGMDKKEATCEPSTSAIYLTNSRPVFSPCMEGE